MEQLPQNLLHPVLAALLFDKERSKMVRHLLPIEAWNSDYGLYMLCKKIYGYIDAYQTAPEQHVSDLIKELSFKPDLEQNLHMLVNKCQARFDDNLNFDYLMNGITKFHRQTSLRSGVAKAMEFIETGKLDEAEELLHKTLKARVTNFDPGITVEEGLQMLLEDRDTNNIDNAITLGIEALDRRLICPTRKELFLFLAGPKMGKTFFGIHAGKRAMMAGKRVLHVTLEVNRKIVLRRYLQNMLNLTHHQVDDRYRYSIHNDEILYTPIPRGESVDESLDYIIQHSEYLKGMLSKLRIKEFGSGNLTVNGLQAFLEGLDSQYGFNPDLLVLDYADLMKIKDVSNKRTELGQLYVELRGLAADWNLALVTMSQVNRSGASSKQVQTTDVAEDFSKIATADNVLTYSQTAPEKEMGLARLYVGAARNEEDKFEVLVSQDYATAQFILESQLLTRDLHQRLKEVEARIGRNN